MVILDSRLSTVRLYHQGATVTRVATISAPAGQALPAEVEIPRLPLSLWDPTVRVRITVQGSGQVVAKNLKIGLYAAPRDAPLESPDAEKLRALEETRSLRGTALTQIQREIDLLASMRVPDRPSPEEGHPPPPSPMTARLAVEELVDETSRTRLDQIRGLRDELRKLDEEILALKEQIRRASTANRISAADLTKTVIIELNVGGEVRAAELELSYFVPGARWAPAYQCRLSRDCRSAEMQLRAMVCQRTGEDWSGVALELSTASPLRWTELPELSATRLGASQAPLPSKRGFRPPPEGAGSLFEDFDRGRQSASALTPRPAYWELPSLAISAPGVAFGSAALQSELDGGPPPAEPSTDAYDDRVQLASQVMIVAEDIDLESSAEEASQRTRVVAKKMAPRREAKAASMGAPMAAAAPAALMRVTERPSPSARSAMLREAGEAAVAVPSDPTLEALVYTQLRLGAPDDPRERNRLRPLDQRTIYLEILARAKVVVDGDVMIAVAEAQVRAAQAAQVPLPSGAIDVRSASAFFDFAYRSDAPVDVPSDGGFHSVPLGSRPLESAVRYVVVPREDSNVYRVASLKNLTAAPFLSGPVEVYVGGEYVLTAQLPAVPPNGEFPLGLGVEQAVKCARNTRYKESRSGTKVVATHELWHELSIELANNLERDIECEVRERIPQPEPSAEVVVEEGTVKPAWQVYDQSERSRPLEGGRRWQVVVPARQRLTLDASYVIKIYANNEIAGGNRREA